METLPRDEVMVRNLRPSDFDAVVLIDQRSRGRRREEFYKVKLRQALSDTGIVVSLAAEVDGALAGFLLARVYYGEFGETERVAVMDAVGVHPDFRNRGIGAALLDQLRMNLDGLGIRSLQTQVNWGDSDLMAFFKKQGFGIAQRLCLELDLDKARP